jgi:hypothetical protein
MSNETYYDYQGLDKLLTEFISPQELCGHLDELLFILMTYVCLVGETPDKEILKLYCVVRDLREAMNHLIKESTSQP